MTAYTRAELAACLRSFAANPIWSPEIRRTAECAARWAAARTQFEAAAYRDFAIESSCLKEKVVYGALIAKMAWLRGPALTVEDLGSALARIPSRPRRSRRHLQPVA